MDPVTPTPGAAPPPPAAPAPEPSSSPGAEPSIEDILAREDAAAVRRRAEHLGEIPPQPEAPGAPTPPAEPAAGTPPPSTEPPPTTTPPPAVPDKTVQILEGVQKTLEALATPKAPAAPAGPAKTEPEYKLFEASDADVDAIIEGGEAGRKALTKVATQATTQSLQLTMMAVTKLMEPVTRFIEQQVVKQAEETYMSQYPEHKDFLDLAREVGLRLQQSGTKDFQGDQTGFFKAVHEEVERRLGAYRQKFGITAPVAPAPSSPPPPPHPGSGAGARGKGGQLSPEQQLMKEMQS